MDDGLPASVLAGHLKYLEMQGRATTTIDSRRRVMRRLARALPVPVLEAGPAELLAWRRNLMVGPDTICGYVSHVQQFYAWAASNGLLTGNPAAGLPVPRLGRRLPRPIGLQDLYYALSIAPPRIRLWLVLAAWCGLRAKEIALLRAENILLTAVPPKLLVARDATKGLHERMIPLSAFVFDEIGAASLPHRGWCFLRRDGQPGPNTPKTVSAIANRFLQEDCGIAATLHMLRHWFGTTAYSIDKDLRKVQELMGHLSIASTSIYADWDKAAAAATVEAFPVPPRLRVVGDGAATP